VGCSRFPPGLGLADVEEGEGQCYRVIASCRDAGVAHGSFSSELVICVLAVCKHGFKILGGLVHFGDGAMVVGSGSGFQYGRVCGAMFLLLLAPGGWRLWGVRDS